MMYGYANRRPTNAPAITKQPTLCFIMHMLEGKYQSSVLNAKPESVWHKVGGFEIGGNNELRTVLEYVTLGYYGEK